MEGVCMDNLILVSICIIVRFMIIIVKGMGGA